jgi:hypothetical protein
MRPAPADGSRVDGCVNDRGKLRPHWLFGSILPPIFRVSVDLEKSCQRLLPSPSSAAFPNLIVKPATKLPALWKAAGKSGRVPISTRFAAYKPS